MAQRDNYYGRRGLFQLSPCQACIGLLWQWGGTGELGVIKGYNAIPAPKASSNSQAAMIEPAAVTLYVLDRGRVAAGSSVLISGLGADLRAVAAGRKGPVVHPGLHCVPATVDVKWALEDLTVEAAWCCPALAFRELPQ